MKFGKIKFFMLIFVSFLSVGALTSCDFLDSTTSSSSGENTNTQGTNNGGSTEGCKIGNSYSYYEGKNYKEVEETLKKEGFENFEVERLGNLITGFLHKPNEITKMSVNGDEKFKSGKYSKDAKIKFTVYSYDNQCPEGHDLEKVTKTDATCFASGISKDAFYCSTCDEYFTDSKGNGSINKSAIVVAKLEHSLVKVEASNSTCSKEGTHEHYECELCHSLFKDSSAATPTTKEECYIDKKPHTVVTDEAVKPTFSVPGKTQGSHCGVCGEVIVEQKTVQWYGSDEQKAMEELFRRTIVVAFSNALASDIYDSAGQISASKIHSYSDKSGDLKAYYLEVYEDGKWTFKSETKAHVEGISLIKYPGAIYKVSLDVEYGNDGEFKLSNIIDVNGTGIDFSVISKLPIYVFMLAEDRTVAYESSGEATAVKNVIENYAALKYPSFNITKYHWIAGVIYYHRFSNGNYYVAVKVDYKINGNKYDGVVEGFVDFINETATVELYSN